MADTAPTWTRYQVKLKIPQEVIDWVDLVKERAGFADGTDLIHACLKGEIVIEIEAEDDYELATTVHEINGSLSSGGFPQIEDRPRVPQASEPPVEGDPKYLSVPELESLPYDELRTLASIYKVTPANGPGTKLTLINNLRGLVPVPPNGIAKACSSCGTSNVLCWARIRTGTRTRTTAQEGACCGKCAYTNTHK